MTHYVVIGFLDGEVTDVVTTWMTSEDIDRHFPVGEVYRYAQEPGGWQWRILQRGKWITGTMSYYAQVLPTKEENVPDIVRMTAMMAI